MATHGRLDEFNEGQEEWRSYIERVDHYFTANDVVDADKKRAIYLSACGAQTYKLVRSLVAPQKPTEFSYSELVKKVSDHYHPKPSVTIQRFTFNSRVRKPGEPIAVYIVELRRLSQDCEFGETLEEMLRDRLVCGISDTRIQRRFFSEDKLDFKRAHNVFPNVMDISLHCCQDNSAQVAGLNNEEKFIESKIQ